MKWFLGRRQYNLETLRSMEGEAIRIRYGEGETGWAKKILPSPVGKINGTRAVILNIPLEPKLLPYDVVVLKDVSGDFPKVARVEWRGFDRKTGIKYPKPYQKNFERISKAFRDVGLVTEGYTSGRMAVAHGKEVDLQSILDDAGVDIDVTFQNW